MARLREMVRDHKAKPVTEHVAAWIESAQDLLAAGEQFYSDPTVAQVVHAGVMIHYHPRHWLVRWPDWSASNRSDFNIHPQTYLLELRTSMKVSADTASDEALYSDDPRLSELFDAGMRAGVNVESALKLYP